jgi:hypothetical protein
MSATHTFRCSSGSDPLPALTFSAAGAGGTLEFSHPSRHRGAHEPGRGGAVARQGAGQPFEGCSWRGEKKSEEDKFFDDLMSDLSSDLDAE